MHSSNSVSTARPFSHEVILKGYSLPQLSESLIFQHTEAGIYHLPSDYQKIKAIKLTIGQGTFGSRIPDSYFPEVEVMDTADGLLLRSKAAGQEGKLNEVESLVLLTLLKKASYRVFFDEALRERLLREKAKDYGLEEEPSLAGYFQLSYEEEELLLIPKLSSLLPVTETTLQEWAQWFVPKTTSVMEVMQANVGQQRILVIKQHKYDRHLMIDLYQAPLSKEGKVKAPFSLLNPLEELWNMEGQQQVKFFAALHRFQRGIKPSSKEQDQDLEALRAIVANPMRLPVYYHQPERSEKVGPTSVVATSLQILPKNIVLSVRKKQPFYELEGFLEIAGVTYSLNGLELRFDHFLLANDTLYLVDQPQVLGLLRLFRQRIGSLLIHERKYPAFRKQVLAKLEERLVLRYDYVKEAGPRLFEQIGPDVEKQLYLSDFGNFVMMTPVIRYGEAEVAVRSRTQIHWEEPDGEIYRVKRDEQLEREFLAVLVRQHSFLEEQVENDFDYFYLHRTRFLDEDWFLDAFDAWYGEGIQIFGFNDLEGSRYNPHKAQVNIQVLSGMNWFNVKPEMRFGKSRASLKKLATAIHDKRKFVCLDDGTLGIIPEEWIQKFGRYFSIGEFLDEETLGIAKSNFSLLEELFDEASLDESVKKERDYYSAQWKRVDGVEEIPEPLGLQASLRTYQREGLSWLNFLDELGFGACLADDMGLGKSIQVIAFLLHLKQKNGPKPHLLVVPTTLIFHWQQELAKFAPTLKLLTHHAIGRKKSWTEMENYDILLTTYGTLVSDIKLLKEKKFDYILLDESQQIKNPASQRYQAARLLQGRNRIAISGTPVENHVLDLFGQFSFINPGLLGNKKYFKDVYLLPIDQFHDRKRLQVLKDKVRPFILRRTKQEVAKELPEKTEVMLVCEMGAQQKKTYQAYEKEFREYISATTNEELQKSAVYVLRGLTQLRQICDSPALLGEGRLPGEESAKLDLLMEQITEKAPNHKMLVFSQFVSMLELIRKELEKRRVGYSYLTGSTRNRSEVVEGFQNEPEKRVFLISLKAGGMGLNLTAADYVYLVDPWWNPAVENQAIDRIHRIGQQRPVMAVRLICADTVEEKMMKLQDTKRALFNELIAPDPAFIKGLSKEDLLALL